MGGGVGLGTLGVTHGLGPEPAKPPPPPPPPPGVSAQHADEREKIWEQNRQAMRDWNAQLAYWSDQRQQQEKYERMRADLDRTAAATEEQRRIRAADLMYRFRPVDEPPSWLPPQHRQHWSTGGATEEASAVREDFATPVGPTPTLVSSPSTEAPTQVVSDGGDVQASRPPADYAILPLGDHAAIEVLKDGTLEVQVDPVKGISAVLETHDGQKFLYGQIGSLAKRQVKAGDVIGFTPGRAPGSAEPGIGATPVPSMAADNHTAGQLPAAPTPVSSWPSAARSWPSSAAATRAGGGAPPNNVVPLRRRQPIPPPPARPDIGVLLIVGLGIALLSSVGGKRRR